MMSWVRAGQVLSFQSRYHSVRELSWPVLNAMYTCAKSVQARPLLSAL